VPDPYSNPLPPALPFPPLADSSDHALARALSLPRARRTAVVHRVRVPILPPPLRPGRAHCLSEFRLGVRNSRHASIYSLSPSGSLRPCSPELPRAVGEPSPSTQDLVVSLTLGLGKKNRDRKPNPIKPKLKPIRPKYWFSVVNSVPICYKPIFSLILRFHASVTRSDRYSTFQHFSPYSLSGPCLQFSTCSGSTSPVLHRNKPYPTIQPSSRKTATRARGTTAGGGAAHSPARLLVAGDCGLPPPEPLPRARTPLLGCWLLETTVFCGVPPPEPLPRAAEPRAPNNDGRATTASSQVFLRPCFGHMLFSCQIQI
jgi:hypothetical protein